MWTSPIKESAELTRERFSYIIQYSKALPWIVEAKAGGYLCRAGRGIPWICKILETIVIFLLSEIIINFKMK